MPMFTHPIDNPDAMAERILDLERQKRQNKRTSRSGPLNPLPTILNPYSLELVGTGAGGTPSPTVDVQAILLALNNHKASADHDGRYPLTGHLHDGRYSLLGHAHDERYSLLGHIHDDKYSLLGHIHDDRYYTETEANTLLGNKTDKSLTLTAGSGLTGGGDLSTGRTFNVGAGTGISVAADTVGINLAANLTWTGSHTFSGSLTTGSIMPALSDTYDLGDYTKPWRKIWGSELSAVVFSKYEQVLLGGWLTISKGEGKLTNAVTSAQTQIDLGALTFATNDILVFRSISSNGSAQVEYMKVGTLVSGVTFNVTRNLDGTGANNWPEGTVFANWGQVGNGRVELNANGTPKMAVYSHGSTWNDGKEQVRIGSLDGNWGYDAGVEIYGGAFGSYESGKSNITIDPTNGIRIRNYDQTVIQLDGYAANFEAPINLGPLAEIRQGEFNLGQFNGTRWTADYLGGEDNGVKQWWAADNGTLYTGGGVVELNEKGISIIHNEDGNTFPNSELKFFYSDASIDTNQTLSLFVSGYNVGNNCKSYSRIHLENNMVRTLGGTNPRIIELDIAAWVPFNGADYSKLYLRAYGPNPAEITMFSWGQSATLSSIGYKADRHSFSGCIVVHAISATADDLSIQSPTNTLAYHAPAGHYFSGAIIAESLKISSLKGVAQTIANDYGNYLHLGAWGVARTAADAVLVNTAYIADNADKVDGYHAASFSLTSHSHTRLEKLGIQVAAGVPALTIFNNPGQTDGSTSHIYLQTYVENTVNKFSEIAFGATRANSANAIWLLRARYTENYAWLPVVFNFFAQAYAGAAQVNVMELSSSGSVWINSNCSALSFTDRTPFYEGDALAEIKAIKGKDGKIDHATLPKFAKVEREVIVEPAIEAKGKVKAKPAVSEIQQERDLGAMISMLTVAIQQLDAKLNDLINKKGIA